MGTAQGVVAAIALVANGFSGIAALFRLPAILPGMAKAAVPQSWLIFPIGTAKTAGALGLMAGPVWPPVGWAAAAGLVFFFVCAVWTHVLARDYSAQFALAIGFLALNTGTWDCR
ncbi:DoxX family protein [Mycolicibacterium fortuitum]|uniref:DoxX family protein n=1 Tax=Mycolicibacterium fortuitum TaxID=1766 RepID=UPI0007E940A5|nr:DoxX family protein [Mycolicibacterium fortuitum]OBB30418.1 hypothetical protein A5763_01890 [Mycolicibacterium fortuitum]OBB50526.1 hypothetical protein A5754_26965 [Mycolicibacterium fortuitum]OBB77038.1 hypothetical protein A5755_11830 [Mycolicibacterium fortuitum]OBF85100.1 hypothetical protein A5751_10440 [Mycolicibacterium fortuitum]OBG13088.1 hypothetical protein A5768_09835 [Mycolicibacterium fortuitum]